MSSAPLLIDTPIEGKPRKLVCSPSKQSWLYCFDRITGTPIWPIVERPVPQSTMAHEKTSATQPFVTKPPAYARVYLAESDVIDFTPELRAQALKNLKLFRWEPTPYVPPTGPESKLLGSINIGNTNGGTNWPGAGFDVETGIFYSQANNSGVTVGHYDEEEFAKVTPENKGNRTPRWEAEPNYGLPRAAPAGGAPAAPAAINFPGGAGRRALGEGLDGLPIVKPPYGVLSAIDLKNPDKLLFSVPHGDTPDAVRNHPLLKGKDLGKTGQGGSVGVLITKTLVIVGDPQFSSTATRPRGAMLRAYDKMTGAQVGEVAMPAPISGSPMTYLHNGRQYVVVAVSGGNYTGEYISFALPQSMTSNSTAPRQ
jgi:quinoprotein glucose dehydrogenase